MEERTEAEIPRRRMTWSEIRAEQKEKGAAKRSGRDAKRAEHVNAEESPLVVTLPDKLEQTLDGLLAPGEIVHVKLKGAFQQGLACTDTRVIILKRGYMTGQLFGRDVFQFPYANVAGAQVKWHLGTGYFELNAGGMQNTPKSYWANNRNGGNDATSAPNSISLNSKAQAAAFQQACTFIMARVGGVPQQHNQRGAGGGAPVSSADALDELAKATDLHDRGVLPDEQFEVIRRRLLAQLNQGPGPGGEPDAKGHSTTEGILSPQTTPSEHEPARQEQNDSVAAAGAAKGQELRKRWGISGSGLGMTIKSPIGPTARRERREAKEVAQTDED
ncbi:MAG: hypothetical protein HKL82_08790 [Acidimicrobiaceae bacterium]|nr:hypothetical protein [Acidimicrobiaceae bacterium]